jgi:DNA-binding transcriptional ArsR family regulator
LYYYCNIFSIIISNFILLFFRILRYNIFMPANISTDAPASLAEIFRLLGQPVRIQILLTIADGRACVCHIEALLHIRQASISQHLMVLRKAGLVEASRDGRNMFYRLAHPQLLETIFQVASISGLSACELELLAQKPVSGCPCPDCNPGMDPDLTCKKIRSK